MPRTFGSAPVISPVPPGSESEGTGVCALVYSAPPVARRASSEVGWLAIYQSRSDWCMPSTEIRSTCLTGLWLAATALEDDTANGDAIANAAVAIPAVTSFVLDFI